jgi:hypothetical protein
LWLQCFCFLWSAAYTLTTYASPNAAPYGNQPSFAHPQPDVCCVCSVPVCAVNCLHADHHAKATDTSSIAASHHNQLNLHRMCVVAAVFLFVGSAAYTLTNMQKKLMLHHTAANIPSTAIHCSPCTTCAFVAAVFLFVGSAAYTVTNMRKKVMLHQTAAPYSNQPSIAHPAPHVHCVCSVSVCGVSGLHIDQHAEATDTSSIAAPYGNQPSIAHPSLMSIVPAVFLFVGSAAYTLTNMRKKPMLHHLLHHTAISHPLLTVHCMCIVAAVFLFVGSAAYTLTNMREDVIDVLYNDDDSITDALAALGFAGFGLGESNE